MRLREFESRKLVIFDIDDTLVHTQTKVHVVSNGRVIKSLNSHDFTHYKLQPGEEFDFGAFRDAKEFFTNAKPIIPMIDQLKHDIATGNKVVMVTARADFNDRELFLDTFRKYGVDMSKVHVYRAGNFVGKDSTEEKKKIIIRNLLNKASYSKAIMYDDAIPNLDAFVSLKEEYPDTKFYAWHVSLKGEATEYQRTNESVSLDHNRTNYEVRNYHKLDKYLSELCDLVERGQASNKDFGMVAAGILPLKGDYMARLNRPGKDGRIHAEHAVIEDFIKKYGSIPEGSVIITTLSPCNTPMDERDGPSCADLLNKHGIQKVYCGYIDPTQHDGAEDQREYNLVETMNKELRTRCEAFADTFLDKVHENLMGFLAKPVKKKTTTSAEEIRKYFEKEKAKEPDKIERGEINKKAQQVYTKRDENFADGKHPEDKGDSARLGIPKHASISSLRKIGHGSGRKAQLARWQANMRSGRNK
jgi:pyrimidine deaminase RibD-like protein/FMN phosphatase YigB (HAD superfamily)